MKKLIFAASALAALTMSTSSFAGTINFEGEITDSTCDVTLEGGTGATTVTLPTISSSLFTGLNSTAGRTAFVLSASNCTLTNGKTRVAAFFNGNTAANTAADPANVDSVTGYLNNRAELGFVPDASAAVGYLATATGVKLRLIDGTSGNVIRAGFSEQTQDAGFVTVNGTTANMPYSVEYIQYSTDPVTAGPVRATVMYDLQYN